MEKATKIVLGKQEDGSFITYAEKLDVIWARVATLNKRVEKTGGAGLAVALQERLSIEKGRGEIIPLVRVTIVGAVPVINGHTFIARVEHHGEIGNIVSRAPDQETAEIPTAFRTCAPSCDHCKMNRKRNDTFLLRTPEGELKQIGRNCLADFIRNGDPEIALRMFSLQASIASLLSEGQGEEPSLGGGGGYGKAYTSTLHWLATCAVCIRVRGWVSRKESKYSDKQATADTAAFARSPKPTHPKLAAEWLELQPSADDFEEASAVVEWAGTLADRPDLNDYLHNVRVACSLGYVERKHEGIVASALPAYRRERDEALASAVKGAVAAVSGHVGEVGARMQLNLTVTRLIPRAGDYGKSSTIVKFVDAAGNVFTWFANTQVTFKVGQTVSGKATVTKHDVYQGVKSTTIARPSF